MNEATGPIEDPTHDLIRHVDGVELPERPANRLGTEEIVGVVIGRDRIVVPPHEVFKLAVIGCKDIEIAEWFGIDSNTLRYNFSVELIKGRETLKHSLRRKQLDVAMSGNPTMLIFLGKNYLGQTDQPQPNDNRQPLPWTDDEVAA
jgi:hypothetical protein